MNRTRDSECRVRRRSENLTYNVVISYYRSLINYGQNLTQNTKISECARESRRSRPVGRTEPSSN